jgi:hypothetical protein
MKTQQPTMSALDVVVLLKIISLGSESWNQKPLAESLFMSQSEISKSVARSRYAGLLDASGKNVRKLAFIDFLKYGIAVVFPQQPGAIVRGIPRYCAIPSRCFPPQASTIQLPFDLTLTPLLRDCIALLSNTSKHYTTNI